MTGAGGSGENRNAQSTAGQAQEKLQQRKEQLREKAAPLVGQAREKTQERAQQLREQATTQVHGQLDARSTHAGEQVRSVAQAARTRASSCETRPGGPREGDRAGGRAGGAPGRLSGLARHG